MPSDQLARELTPRLAGGRAASRSLVTAITVLGLAAAAPAGAAVSLRRYLTIADAVQLTTS
jgi:hypothetical protein